MKKNTYKILKIILIIPLVILIIIGFTYAFWIAASIQENENIINTLKCLETSLTDETGSINLVDEYPVSNEEGMQKEPYTFIITNNCNSYVNSDIALEVLTGSTLDNSYARVSLQKSGDSSDNSKILTTFELGIATISDATNYKIENIMLGPNETQTYDLRLWLDYDAPESQMNKIFNSKIIIKSRATAIPLAQKILINNGGESAIIELPIIAFSKIAAESGLFKTIDDYGTSYYFRGEHDKVNNWVEFAGFYWRIVRIDGEGNIKMIYNGVADGNPQKTGKQTQIEGTHVYYSTRNDNTYIGLKNKGSISKSYLEAHQKSNGNPSNALIQITNWYNTNITIQESNITNKIASNVAYCNDRNLYSGNGYGAGSTEYGAYGRLSSVLAHYKPTLKCQNTVGQGIDIDNDQYSMPVGLITADEVSFAGGKSGTANSSYWLYTSQSYSTMSPSHFYNSNVYMLGVSSSGLIDYYSVNIALGIRPVIAIKANTKFVSGTGSIADMYSIS